MCQEWSARPSAASTVGPSSYAGLACKSSWAMVAARARAVLEGMRSRYYILRCLLRLQDPRRRMNLVLHLQLCQTHGSVDTVLCSTINRGHDVRRVIISDD